MRHLTKPLILVTIMIALLLLASCGKDDGPEPVKEEVAEKQRETPKEEAENPPKENEKPTEDTASSEESNKIADNVIIRGGSKIEGPPPVPNGAINLLLPEAPTVGVLDEGFEIPLFSEADITGVYLQFKAINGDISESYYDVNITANLADSDKSGKSAKIARRAEKKNRDLTAKGAEGPLDIDLGAEIGPGEFCYVICAYDADGNISTPQEVCVTINAFGGNEALVGTWNLVRYEDTYEGITEIDIVGEEYCNETSCETEEYDTIIFNADGTWESESRYIQRDIEGEYGSVFDEYLFRGKWSYPSGEDSDLILVDYYYSVKDENGFEEETYAAGESEEVISYSSENIELTETGLKLTETYDDDGDGNFEEVYTIYYEKQ